MKKLLLILLFIPFLACSSDDDSTPEISLSRTDVTGGTWYLLSIKEDGKWVDYSSLYMRVTFREDSTYTFIGNEMMGDSYYVGKWKMNNNTITATTVDNVIETYKFISIDGTNAELQYSNNYNWKTPTNVKVKKK